MQTSPYAPPRAVVADPVTPNSAAAAIREEHIRHEVQLKSVGSLYYLGAILTVLAALGMVAGLASAAASENRSLLLGIAAFYLVLGVASGFLGYGFRRLRPWVTIPGTILAVLGLLAIPVGTLINGWILYLIHCKKGRTVLGADYQAIVDATPHIKYRRTVGDWIAIGLLLALVLGVIALVVLGGR